LLRHSLGLEEAATAIEEAVRATIRQGVRSADVSNAGGPHATTAQVVERIVAEIKGSEPLNREIAISQR
jgi:3-isopropylmalate dehydrogenase